MYFYCHIMFYRFIQRDRNRDRKMDRWRNTERGWKEPRTLATALMKTSAALVQRSGKISARFIGSNTKATPSLPPLKNNILKQKVCKWSLPKKKKKKIPIHFTILSLCCCIYASKCMPLCAFPLNFMYYSAKMQSLASRFHLLHGK